MFTDLYGDIPVYPLFIVVACFVGAMTSGRMMVELGVPGGRVVFLVVGTAVVGLAGAKLFAAVERGGVVWWDPWWELSHGYRYPGGIIAIVTAAPLLKRCLPPEASLMRLADAQAPGIALAMGVMRIGCFVVGCCHGPPSTLPWAMRFPVGSPAWLAHVERGWLDPQAVASLPIHPLQIYFGLTSLAVASLLCLMRSRMRAEGELFCWFLVLDGLIKLLLEQLRFDSQIGLQFAAAVMAMAGCVGLILLARHGHRGLDMVGVEQA